MTNTVLTINTKAKLNLSLHVMGKRADGYHDLHSIVAFCDSGDILHVEPSDTLILTLSGRFSKGLNDKDNLVIRAARALQIEANMQEGAHLHLEKRLPIASGIGGGSGDAAAALRLLNQLWRCGFSDNALSALGATLGADIPVCLYGKTCMMEGVGDRINTLPYPLPSLYAVLVNPLIGVSTPTVFQELQGKEWSVPVDGATYSTMKNDLQSSAMRLCPAIADIVEAITTTRPLASRMSGSGTTCFGLYESASDAKAACITLTAHFSSYWVTWGALT